MDSSVATPGHIAEIQRSVTDLLDYCKRNDWAGFDPYDALNSRLYAGTPLYSNRICSVALTQIMKRLPIDFRPLLSVTREQNPKALALFLMACLRLSKAGVPGQEVLAELMIERLVALRSLDTPYWCWGYSFPWQTRTLLVPKGAPNMVCTVFVANALLDAYAEKNDARCLAMAVSAAEYMLNELYWDGDGDSAGFSYPLPVVRAKVHNANFLGAALFCRIYRLNGGRKFLDAALKVARYSASKQHDDGSWDYGEHPKQRWVDNFHTGYNLCALQEIGQYASTSEFEPSVRKGLEFYLKHFFREDGAPRYFHDRTYPIDIHCVAQSIITLLTLKSLDETNVPRASSMFTWALNNMRDEQGYFYYQVLPFYTNKISYMRWSQAWMLLALSTLLEECGEAAAGEVSGASNSPGQQEGSCVSPWPRREEENGCLPAYVLITPARNEAAFIELTITSVISQTILPRKWVIVSDGSTDGTDDIVARYAAEHPWIELVRMPERTERHFAGKVHAFNAGYEKIKNVPYDIIGSLDADISFERDYFSFLLAKFAENSRLGVGGTPFREGSHQYDYRFTSIEHVSGACQLFRRECFEEIGGYVPIKNGGIDWTAVTTARMKGWKTRTFPEKVCIHHRKIGTGKSTLLVSRFRFGKQDYYLGGHGLWEIFRSLYQMKSKPYILGGLALYTGYLWAFVSRAERQIPRELVAFRKKEQMERLKNLFIGRLGSSG